MRVSKVWHPAREAVDLDLHRVGTPAVAPRINPSRGISVAFTPTVDCRAISVIDCLVRKWAAPGARRPDRLREGARRCAKVRIAINGICIDADFDLIQGATDSAQPWIGDGMCGENRAEVHAKH